MSPFTILGDDAPKWTDIGLFGSTAVQTLIVGVASIIALCQYLASLRGDRVRLTLEQFQQINSEDFRSAVDRISQHLDYRNDWAFLLAIFSQPAETPSRLQCERDIWTITNVSSKLLRLIEAGLMDRCMFLDEMDEYFLQIAAAISSVHLIYKQPDYRGLFQLAHTCQKNYRKRSGRYQPLVDLPLPSASAPERAI